jgi:hypothetical protein
MSVKPKKRRQRPARVATDDEFETTAAGLAWASPPTPGPSPRVKELLLARIRGTRAKDNNEVRPGWRFESTGAAEGWRTTKVRGVRFKTLSVDEARDVVMLLMEMEPGAHFPDHAHTAGGDEGLVISGDVITGGRLMRAGDYYHAAEGTTQGETVSPSGCTALLSLTARAWKTWREALA